MIVITIVTIVTMLFCISCHGQTDDTKLTLNVDWWSWVVCSSCETTYCTGCFGKLMDYTGNLTAMMTGENKKPCEAISCPSCNLKDSVSRCEGCGKIYVGLENTVQYSKCNICEKFYCHSCDVHSHKEEDLDDQIENEENEID